MRELLLAAPERVVRLMIDRRRDVSELVALAEPLGVTIAWVDAEALARETGGADPRGVVAIARPPEPVPLDALLGDVTRLDAPPRRIVVALDGVVDPQNLGAIMRSAEFFGVRGLVWSRDRAAGITASVVRASAGASERVPLCPVTNLASALRACQDAGLWLVGTVAEGGEPLSELVLRDRVPDRVVLVLGSEGQGLRRLTRERCDFLATIERRGAVGSLNVSAAAAVCLSWLASTGAGV